MAELSVSSRRHAAPSAQSRAAARAEKAFVDQKIVDLRAEVNNRIAQVAMETGK